MGGWALYSQRPITQSFHLPHPEYPGLVLALKQGWVLIGALPLDALVHITQGGGHLSHPLGRSWAWGLFPLGALGGLTIPFFHISSCLAESTFPPESGTMLQR